MKAFTILTCSLLATLSLHGASPPVPVADVVNAVRVPAVIDRPGFFTVIAPDGVSAAVIFDASASSDADNDPLQFYWAESDEGSLHVFATGVRTTNVFEVGGHGLGLSVSDGSSLVTTRFGLTVYTPAEIVTALIDVLGDDALPGKPRHSLIVPLEKAVESFERGDADDALHSLRVFLARTRVQSPSPNPVRAAGVRQLTQLLIETISGN